MGGVGVCAYGEEPEHLWDSESAQCGAVQLVQTLVDLQIEGSGHSVCVSTCYFSHGIDYVFVQKEEE